MAEKDYSKTNGVSNSMLGWLATSPRYFQKRVATGYDDDTSESWLNFGTLIHAYLLEFETFHKKYFIQKYNKPSNAVQNKLCDIVIGANYTDLKDWVNMYKLVYSTKGKSATTIEAETTTLYNTYIGYVESEINHKGLIGISEDEMSKLQLIRKNVNEHEAAYKLINNDYYVFDENIIINNEFIIEFILGGIQMKAKIDRFIIDVKAKTITIVDLKTSSLKREEDNFGRSFKYAIDKYEYDRQLYVYGEAVKQWLAVYRPDLQADAFIVLRKIVAIKSNFDYEVRVFNLDESYFRRGKDRFEYLVELFKFYEEHGYEHDMDYYVNSGEETLTLN